MVTVKSDVAIPLTKMARLPLFRIFVVQSSVTIFTSIAFMMVSKIASISALLAGLSCVLPSLFIFLVSLKPIEPGQNGFLKVLRGQFGKFVLTIAILSSIFALVSPLSVSVFFANFVLMQVCVMVVPLADAYRITKSRFTRV